jgi:ABC-type Fe3+-hydroxamate transport system substrate-binding protein
MGLKLRASYIVLAISIVILAIGIILITNHFTSDRTAEPPTITTLVDKTVVIPVGETRRVYFSVPESGVLMAAVELETGDAIHVYLYKDSESLWADEEANGVKTCYFDVPVDAGRYYLSLAASWWLNLNREDVTVGVHLEFED